MIRKMVIFVKVLGRRRRWVLPLLLWSFLSWVTYSWLGEEISRALQPPPPPDQNLHHFRKTSDLQHYLNNINLLIEPSSVSCDGGPVVVVSSAPAHAAHRRAIRNSWGRHLHTYFILGLRGNRVDEDMVDNYVEAKEYGDMIIFDFPDHYQNLTLKSVLMLQWTLRRCPAASFLFKTDDDVLVNPWTLEKVLKDHPDADLLGYKKNESRVHRDRYNKWYVPRWLRRADRLPRYLSGTGYFIRGAYLESILNAAKKVPLINLEDVYLTYLVSNDKLKLNLVHDRRLSPYRPWINLDCAYWTLASTHSFKPDEIAHAWAKIEKISKDYKKNGDVCGFYKNYIESEYFLY